MGFEEQICELMDEVGLTGEAAVQAETVHSMPTFIGTVETMLGKMSRDKERGSEDAQNLLASVARILKHAYVYIEQGFELQRIEHAEMSSEEEIDARVKVAKEIKSSIENVKSAVAYIRNAIKVHLGPEWQYLLPEKNFHDTAIRVAAEYANFAAAFERTLERAVKKDITLASDEEIHSATVNTISKLSAALLREYSGYAESALQVPGYMRFHTDMETASQRTADIVVVKMLPTNKTVIPVKTTLPMYNFATGIHTSLVVENAFQSPGGGKDGKDVIYIMDRDWERIIKQGDPVITGKIDDREFARTHHSMPIATRREVINSLLSFGYDLHADSERRFAAIHEYIREHADDVQSLENLRRYLQMNVNLQGNHPDKSMKRLETAVNCLDDLQYAESAMEAISVTMTREQADRTFDNVRITHDAPEL